MNKLLPAALCGLPLLAFSSAALADNVVAQTVQRLHLSPQQLLSLRDFLGSFSRGMAVEASGNGLFVLRDARSMGYAGEFSLRADPNGTLTVDRVGGAATLDLGRYLQVPLKLAAKARAQAISALAESQALPADGAAQAALPPQTIAGAALTNAGQPASILQSRAVFFRDGSGYAVSVRAQSIQAHAPLAPLRIAERYYAPIKSDGKQAWRTAIVEVDGDVTLGFAELETGYGCAAAGPCAGRSRFPAQANLHIIRWGRQGIAAVPISLMAQLAPQPPSPPPPKNVLTASPEITVQQPPQPDAPPAPSETPAPAPEHPSGM